MKLSEIRESHKKKENFFVKLVNPLHPLLPLSPLHLSLSLASAPSHASVAFTVDLLLAYCFGI